MKILRNKKIILTLVTLLILGIIIIIVFYFSNKKKIDSVVIDINNIESYNIKISMAPSYSTIIHGTKDSIIKLNSKVIPDQNSKQKIEWITSNKCAKVNDKNYLEVTGNCEFNVYAKVKNTKSNILNFKISD